MHSVRWGEVAPLGVTYATQSMAFRLTILMLAISGFLSGCLEEKCGPNQKLVKGYCLCEAGFTANDAFQCVENTPAPAPQDQGGGATASDAGHDAAMTTDPPPANGCDQATGLGCPCTKDADCAGKQADYCVIDDPNTPGETRACLLQGCDQPGKECPDVMQCCSFFLAPDGTICLPKDVACPFG